jgi:hypothetical protein
MAQEGKRFVAGYVLALTAGLFHRDVPALVGLVGLACSSGRALPLANGAVTLCGHGWQVSRWQSCIPLRCYSRAVFSFIDRRVAPRRSEAVLLRCRSDPAGGDSGSRWG